MSAGIDYGSGMTNIDVETGIRFGVISQHSIGQAWADSAEADYGKPTCPKCGDEAIEYDESKDIVRDQMGNEQGQFECGHGCADFMCENCEYVFDSSDAYGDEPLGWSVDDGEYKLVDCLDSDVMVILSPYYTFAPFCSPCVPGAGDLDGADNMPEGDGWRWDAPAQEWRQNDTGEGFDGLSVPSGVKTYCVGHDWFEDGTAPYPVFSVATGAEVAP